MNRLRVSTKKSKNKTMIISRFTLLLEQARPVTASCGIPPQAVTEVKDYFAVGGVEGEYEEVKK